MTFPSVITITGRFYLVPPFPFLLKLTAIWFTSWYLFLGFSSVFLFDCFSFSLLKKRGSRVCYKFCHLPNPFYSWNIRVLPALISSDFLQVQRLILLRACFPFVCFLFLGRMRSSLLFLPIYKFLKSVLSVCNFRHLFTEVQFAMSQNRRLFHWFLRLQTRFWNFVFYCFFFPGFSWCFRCDVLPVFPIVSLLLFFVAMFFDISRSFFLQYFTLEIFAACWRISFKFGGFSLNCGSLVSLSNSNNSSEWFWSDHFWLV